MSSPMFVALPTLGSGIAPVLGASLAAFSGATPLADLTAVGTEPMLIEEVSWCAEKFSTAAGQLILVLVDGGGAIRVVGAYDISAGTATLFSNGKIQVDLPIPAGFKLSAAHDVKDAGAAYTNLHLVPLGGVVR